MSNKLPLSRFTIVALVLTVLSFIPVLGLVILVLAIIFTILALRNFKKWTNRWKWLIIATFIILLVSILWNMIFGLTAWLSVYKGYKDREQEVMEETDVAVIMTLVLWYVSSHGVCPQTISEAIAWNNVDSWELWNISHISYSTSDDKQTYEIRAPWRDKINGTEDDIIQSWSCY